MSVTNAQNSRDLKEAALLKEKEWRQILELRIETLENELEKQTEALTEERQKLQDLKTDFKHNFALLKENEQELLDLRNSKEVLLDANEKLEADFSEVSLTNEKLRLKLDQEQNLVEELKSFYKESLDKHKRGTEDSRKKRELQYREEMDILIADKNSLLKQLAVSEESHNTQQQKLADEYENKVQEIESDFNGKISNLEQQVFSLELEKDMHVKDLQTVTSAANSLKSELEDKDSLVKNMESFIQELKFRLTDLEKLSNAKLKQCESELLENKELFSEKETEYKLKVDNLQYSISSQAKDIEKYKSELEQVKAELTKEKKKYKEMTQSYEKEMAVIKNRHQSELHQKDSNYEKLFDEKRRLQQDLELCTLDKDRFSKMVTEEAELTREKLDRMKHDLATKNADLERYRNEVSTALETNRALQQQLEQKDIDWSQKCEHIEASCYEKSEALVKTLSDHRSKMSVEISELKRNLLAKSHLVDLLKRERDCSVLTLKRHNLSIDFDSIPVKESSPSDVSGLKSSEFEKLSVQNENLREVIRKMRDEMEVYSKESEAKITKQSNSYLETISKLEQTLNEKDTQLQDAEMRIRNLEEKLSENSMKKQQVTKSSDDKELFESNENANSAHNIQYEYLSHRRKCSSEIRSLKTQLEKANQFIDQLKGEKLQLERRSKLHPDANVALNPREAEYIVELHNKLKLAAKQINFLAKERQRLIMTCNKLRSVASGGDIHPSRDQKLAPVDKDHSLSKGYKSKFDQIQELQYLVAKKQLAENNSDDNGLENDVAKRTPSSLDSKYNQRPKRISSPVLTSSPSTSSNFQEPLDSGAAHRLSSNQYDPFKVDSMHNMDPTQIMDVMSSIGGDSTLQNIMKMVDKGPDIFSPMIRSLNLEESTLPVNTVVNKNEKNGVNLEVVGDSGIMKTEREKRQVVLSEKAQGKLKPTQSRTKIVRNYNERSFDAR